MMLSLPKAAIIDEHVHAKYGSTFNLAGNGDGQHGLASLIFNHANEVESGGGGVEAQLGGIENHTGLGSNLRDRG
jgi:hypothetical protein